MKTQTNSKMTEKQKGWLWLLGSLTAISMIGLCVLVLFNTFWTPLQYQPPPTPTSIALFSGDGKNYLPTQSQMPSGFRIVDDESGQTNFTEGSMYELAFTNPDLIFEQREVNVLYTSAVFENLTFAIDAYKRVSNPIAYPDSTTREVFMLADFANVDEATLFFGEDINDLGMPAISYTLIFRHKNLLFVVIVSAPVDSYDDNYAMQMKNRLRKAVIYYSSFILEKIPISSIADIPLPPFGEFSLVTNTPEVVDNQYESIIEQVYTPKPPPNAIFADILIKVE